MVCPKVTINKQNFYLSARNLNIKLLGLVKHKTPLINAYELLFVVVGKERKYFVIHMILPTCVPLFLALYHLQNVPSIFNSFKMAKSNGIFIDFALMFVSSKGLIVSEASWGKRQWQSVFSQTESRGALRWKPKMCHLILWILRSENYHMNNFRLITYIFLK